MTRDARTGGFTLLELVAVLAVYSLIATVSVQVLSGAIRNRGVAEEAMHEVTEAVAVLRVLRRDLEALSPAPGTGDAAVAFASTPDGALSLRTQGDAGLRLVQWRFDDATRTLWRRSAAPDGRAPAAPVAMLDGVRAWRVRTLGEAGDWVAAEGWEPAEIADLPRAVEVTLDLDALGALRVVAAR